MGCINMILFFMNLVIILGALVINYTIVGAIVFLTGLILPLSSDDMSDLLIGYEVDRLSWISSLILTVLEYHVIYNFIMERVG